MSQVITNAFEQYWQSSLAAEQPVVLDEFILADIPNLDITSPIDPDAGLPPESQIVHRQNVDQRGRINNNAVAYTIVMDTTVGDFSFNAMYLRNKQNGVIGMIVYKGRETKLKTDQTTGQTGNSLVKSMLMGYDQAAEATLTNVDAGTWQIDYAARLRGQDEDLRQLASQLYGHHTFIGDGFKVVQQDGGHQVTQGVAIVGGLRIELKQPQVIYPGTKPIGVWVDVHRAGSLLSEHQNHFTIITSVADLTDHVDSNGYQHYVAKLATVLADGTIEDSRGSAGGGSGGAGAIPDTFALWKRSMEEAGYDLIGKFGSKVTIKNAKQVLLHEPSSKVYSWAGELPKVAEADEAPAENTQWVSQSDALLRNTTQDMRNDILNGVVFPIALGDVLTNGMVVPLGTTYLRISVRGKSVIVKAWDDVTYPFTFYSVVENKFAGYDVTTSTGIFEFVSTEVKRKRDKGYIDGWGCVSGVLNDVALQKAINSASNVRLPSGEWFYKKIKLRSNIVIEGDNNIDCVLKQVQPTDSSTGGFYKEPGNLKNVQFISFAYDGQRKANPTSPYNHACYIEVNENEVVEDILAYRLDMRNSQEDFINVTSYSNNARVRRVKAKLCRFSTDVDKVNLIGNPLVSSGNGLRLWNRADPNTSYGVDVFVGCSTFGCEGELIRTVSDFKRGCKTFSIMNNITVNCLDCHHSVDGSFDGVIQGNVGRNEPTFSLGKRPNMIEVQGEDISILGNEFDGGNVTTAFINVTDYGAPEEGNGTTLVNIGHRSTDISVIGNKGKSVTQNVFNGINNFNSQWMNNSARNCTGHSFAQSSGTARNDATTGLPLTADGNKYAGNTERNNGLPLSVRNATRTVLGSNTDEHGNESLYLGGGNLLVPASEYAAFKQTVMAENLNPNPQLTLNELGAGIAGWSCPREVVTAATKPAGALNAVTINDDSIAANLEHVIAERCQAVKNEILYVSLDVKRNTATSCGVLFQEFNSSGVLIASYFKDLPSTPVNWTKYITKHKVVSASCVSVSVGMLPAASYNNPPATGKTDIARVYVGRVPM
ncbi:phage tail protein [Aeromonas caviae]|uniref:phage tail-collar fiber domain-containing protein n=1 Tax=Aeromonas caviae TaxID=648 RepID=UPI001F413972|nr:phage tail protein [Aeromonas caviae]